MPPSHTKALQDIISCRTEALGGAVFFCDQCKEFVYSYHSCGNRHCPKCRQDRADRWRDRQLEKLVPVPYFLVTCTLRIPSIRSPAPTKNCSTASSSKVRPRRYRPWP